MCSHNRPAAATASEYPVSNAGAGEKWIKSLTQNRLGTFLGGHFAGVNLSSVLFTHRLDGEEHVQLQVWSAPGRDKPGFEEAMKQEFKPAKKGDRFGPSCEWSRGVGAWVHTN
jgi:alpha-mannosidase